MPRALPTAVACVALGLIAPGALASGFATARLGGEHGTPVSPNPAAVYYNPAAIVGTDGGRVLLDVIVFVRGDGYTHAPHPTDEQEPPGLEGANTDEASLMNVAVVPAIAATYGVGDLAFGAAFHVPFGGGSLWDDNERFAGNQSYPGAVGGPQRWHALDGTYQVYAWTLAVAYEIPKTGLSIGASGSLLRSDVASLVARTALGTNDMEDEGRSLLVAGSWDAAFAAGAVFEAARDVLWLGGSYTSRPNVAGGQRLSGTLKNNFGSVDEVAVDLHQDLPDIVRLGVRWRPAADLELRLHGDWTRWSAFENQCVSREGERCDIAEDGRPEKGTAPLQNLRRDWQDGFGVRLGASVWLRRSLEVFTGLGYDSNAIPDETLEPSFLDFDDFGTTIGARVKPWSDRVAIEVAYTQFFNLLRNTGGKGTLAAPADTFARVPDAGGVYTEWAGLLNTDVEIAF